MRLATSYCRKRRGAEMPRTSSFSTEEDVIILGTEGQKADVVNERLVAKGFEPRSARQLTQRRQALKQRPPQVVGEATGADPEALLRENKRLEVRKRRLTEQLAAIEETQRRNAELVREKLDEMLGENV